jgi:hypothetical protein
MTTGGQLWLTNGNATGQPWEGGVSVPVLPPHVPLFDSAAIVVAVVRALNAALTGLAGRHGALVADVHGWFLGHGVRAGAPSQVLSRPASRDLWYCNLIEPNAWGAHEIRRTWWQTLHADRPRRPRSPGWPTTGCPTRRSGPGCSSAPGRSSTTCARSSPSSASARAPSWTAFCQPALVSGQNSDSQVLARGDPRHLIVKLGASV